MNRTADAIIVGAGVIGSAVAFELATWIQNIKH